jgi:hypothetical protein
MRAARIAWTVAGTWIVLASRASRYAPGSAKTDPIFAEERRHALEYHHALLEWESLNLGRCKHSPLPYFDRLKAEMPGRHVDKALIGALNVTVGTTLDPGADAAQLLRDMLASLTDSSRALLANGPTVIDVPPALPEGDPPR